MTDEKLRQRRGKNSGDAAAASPAAEKPAGNGKGKKEEKEEDKLTPLEQLRSARAKLVLSRDRTADLHAAWKGQLFLLSLCVVVVALHQLQSSVSSCLLEIKEAGGRETTTGGRAAMLALGDSQSEALGVVVASLLAYFLALAKMSGTAPFGLDEWPYIMSSALVPVTLGLYFHGGQAGCLSGESGEAAVDAEEGAADQRHQFPVVAIYHTIVTVAFWFMKNGRQQCEEHVELVDNSIRDFTRMEEKLKLREQLRRRKAGKK